MGRFFRANLTMVMILNRPMSFHHSTGDADAMKIVEVSTQQEEILAKQVLERHFFTPLYINQRAE